MELDFAFICDYADYSGKLAAIGIGVPMLFAEFMPATQPTLHLVAQVRFRRDEAGTHALKVRMLDPDGKDMIQPFSGVAEIPVPPEDDADLVHPFTLAFGSVTFQQYGIYTFVFGVDDQEFKRIPLILRK